VANAAQSVEAERESRVYAWRFVQVPEHLQEKLGVKMIDCPNYDGTGMVRRPGSDVDCKRMWERWDGPGKRAASASR
jgi:hypothetical protein